MFWTPDFVGTSTADTATTNTQMSSYNCNTTTIFTFSWHESQHNSGPENIPDPVLKECADQLTHVLTDIFKNLTQPYGNALLV